jgi:hypothetical protein
MAPHSSSRIATVKMMKRFFSAYSTNPRIIA